ncbi:hypothetical protein [Aliiroseovarius marinus]|uniref:hypothetical protein n=1 Tax=Aliiroseovarius marinus TaxID=2500159 RepID=UPI003D7E47DF
MASFSFAGTVAGASILYESGITDVQITWQGGQAYLYTVSGSADGVMAFSIGSGGTLTLREQIATSSGTVASPVPTLEVVEHNGSETLLAFGQYDWLLSGFDTQGNAGLGNVEQYQWGPSGVGLLSAFHAAQIDGTTHIYAASTTGTGFKHYTVDASNTFTLESDHSQFASIDEPDIVDFETINVGGTEVLIAISSLHDGIQSFTLDSNGTPTLVSDFAAENYFPVGNPTKITTVEVGGSSFVIAAAAGSSSLTVLEVASDGKLTPVDHVIDNLFTRFSDVTEIASITVGDRAYVVAGGSDDGLSLFTVLSDGTLVLLDTIEDTNSTTLQNISALEMVNIGGQIVVYVTSETEAGITSYTIDPGSLGQIIEGGIGSDTLAGGASQDMLLGGLGNDTLSGGNGADILKDGDGQDTLTGGSGADRFCLVADDELDTITDFNPSQDTLDLSGYHMLYDANQLNIQSMSWGAKITYRDETLDIYRAGGGALNASHFTTNSTLTLERPPNGFEQIADVFSGTAGDDVLVGDDGRDILHGLDGNDTILWSEGGDLLYGGAGIDTVSYASAATGVTVNLNTGAGDGGALGDQYDSIENVQGSQFADHLTGNGGANQLFGGNGNDVLNGGAGADHLDGGQGIDTLSYAYQGQSVHVSLLTGTATGGASGDTWANIEDLRGSNGSDVLEGEHGNNRIEGGDGHDVVHGQGGQDTLLGENGNDTLHGGDGNDTLEGGDGNDHLHGDDGDDILRGGNGDDVLSGGAGADQFIGGAGTDTLDYSGISGGVTIDFRTGVGTGNALGDTIHSIEVIGGSNANDNIGGTDDSETLQGNAGNDVLKGHMGDDSLYGGTGDDVLIGGVGADVMFGGTGMDTVSYAAAAQGVELSLQSGGTIGEALGDQFNSIERVVGSDHNDVISGNSSNNYLEGGQGDDVLIGGGGNDQLVGGSGFDLISYETAQSAANVWLWSGTGSGAAQGDSWSEIEGVRGSNYNDLLSGDDQDNRLEGGRGNDRLYGGLGADLLLGGDGNDSLFGGDGDDDLHGGSGDDTFVGGSGADVFNGGDGIDTLDYSSISGGVVVDFTNGTGAGDTAGDQIVSIEIIRGSEQLDIIRGSTDADRLYGEGGNDTLHGDLGNDRLFGGYGGDILTGDDGADSLFGQAGTDTLNGGDGDDILSGGDGNDVSYGEDGNDLFYSGNGNDLFDGGTGFDTVSYLGQSNGVTINLSKGWHAGAALRDRFVSIEEFIGTNKRDLLTGSSGNDTFRGANGHDVLNGRGGDDVLYGGMGNDRFIAGLGSDRYYGDTGRDTVDMRYSSSAATVDLALNTAGGSMSGDKFYSIEILWGSKYGDVFTGNWANNVFKGFGGNDRMHGGNGHDTLYGGGGHDYLWGGSGNDTLRGYKGRDYLDGGPGNDRLYGGQGGDTFVFNAGRDHFKAFSHKWDTIRLDRDLWGGGWKSVKNILKYAKIKGGKAHFDFGGGDKLVIDGVKKLSYLEDNIETY